MTAEQWNDIKKRVLTLDELHAILNKYNVPFNADAQDEMIAMAQDPCAVCKGCGKLLNGGATNGC